ncbi:transglycosylase SLT domain-containing protein [Shouchella clausii]|uniref:Transglycosylase SLT domain-containing protein n=1 Tax=Shouchella clausii (strain KSM-K16) TaxID=66692 RepID=Q5WHB9_SHOC1|nr:MULTISPECIES: transglycosylase SLT domain-containing protein [Shouchella]MCM3312471.1 transglycosylase SLT domain-containing protein [Psychrobacillus sp. MER TA 17]ALA51130.1 hypothetical protein DB29_00302 [Shouchella clausii]MDO7282950.1 transglycosylase SLT domain-containing protein [Shouchella clausii]MDO7303047.1 transglycosylase SLT domain-containing protein [Shouchella clausii]MDP0462744.1 transglycosylase SLT domain-containing protein [Shouchella rhizosphaerae]
MKRTMKVLLAAALAALVGGAFLLIHDYRETNKELAKENEEMRQLFGSMEEELQETGAVAEELSFEDNHQVWSEAMKLADELYEDSDGHFKKEWGMYLAHLAEQKQMNPYLVYELLKVESGEQFDTNAVGPKTKYGHAYGMAQFMTNTAPWIAEMAGVEYRQELLFDPFYAIQLSVEYLDFLYDQYGDWDKALTAYNRGMGGLESYINENGDAKSSYAVKIQTAAERHGAPAVVYAGDE